jgi:2-succinyl-6-hydroxy-2,4-cyclohexadiene-1-carboxylate synthase
VEAFVREWLQNPMFAGLSAENSQIDERLKNSAEGLADSLRYAGTGTQTPLWENLSEVNIPTLIISGELDKKFSEIASRMNSLMPRSTLAVVQGSGHTVHLEKPETFLKILQEWLSATDSVEG